MASHDIQSDEPVWDHPVKDRLLGRLLEDRAALYGDRVFLKFRGEMELSFRDLHLKSNRYANGLRALGLERGKKVAVMLPNCPEYLYLLFGAARLGAATVPINTAYKAEFLSHIIQNSDAEILVVDRRYLDAVFDVAGSLSQLKTIVIREESTGSSGDAREGPRTRSLSSFLDEPADGPDAEVLHTDPVMILYTGGTTGRSKGVVMTNHFYYFYARMVAGSIGYVENDVSFTCMPMFHINAQIGSIVAALYAGAQVAVYEKFSAGTFWDEIRASGATVFLGMGAVGNILMKASASASDADNRVRLAVIVPPPGDLEGFERRFGLRVIYETFGMTEALILPPTLHEPRRPGCCGKPVDDFEVRVVDDDDLPVPPNQTGEIVMRPKHPYTMMSGYYKMPEATLEAFRNLWFHTGDHGYFDQEGFLYYVGRKKDAIRRRGENISAFEIEKVVNQHPAVFESAAVAVPSDLGEDEVEIVVVLRSDGSVTEEELIRFCEPRMAYFMVPRYVEFRESLPKNPSQRVEKYKLRAEGLNETTWDREKAGVKLKR